MTSGRTQQLRYVVDPFTAIVVTIGRLEEVGRGVRFIEGPVIPTRHGRAVESAIMMALDELRGMRFGQLPRAIGPHFVLGEIEAPTTTGATPSMGRFQADSGHRCDP